MSLMHGNVGNWNECANTNSGTITEMPAVTASIHPEHGGKTRQPISRRISSLPMPFLVFLALQAAFFLCVAWTRISAPNQKALASSSDAGAPANRLADSKVVGSGLSPSPVREFLEQPGTADVALRKKASPKERKVSSPSSEITSQTVIAIPPPSSANAFRVPASHNPDVKAADDISGQTTAEEIHPPEVSAILDATAGHGSVPASIVNAPVRMPGEPPRVSSGVTGGQIAHSVKPVYPEQARTQRLQGAVVLEAMVREDGTVEHVTVLSSGASLLGNAARQAVEHWRFTPLELDGKAVPMRKQITIEFTLP